MRRVPELPARDGGLVENTGMNWRKASYSTGGATNCVEVASALGAIGVRDTKQAHLADARTVLCFAPEAWREFTVSLR